MISRVELHLLDQNYDVIQVGKSVRKQVNFFTSYGNYIVEDHEGTSNGMVNVRGWYDTGVADRYQVAYHVRGQNCIFINPQLLLPMRMPQDLQCLELAAIQQISI